MGEDPHPTDPIVLDARSILGVFRDTAHNLELARAAWIEGDKEALRLIGLGYSVIGDSYAHRMRDEARTPVEDALDRLRTDLLPIVLPRCDPTLRDRVQSLVVSLNPEGVTKDDEGEEVERWRLSWPRLRLNDEIDSVAVLLRSRGDAIALEAQPAAAADPSALFIRIAKDVRALAEAKSFTAWEREVELGRLFVPAIETNAVDLLNLPEFTLWCRRHLGSRDRGENWLFCVSQEVRKFLGGTSSGHLDGVQAERISRALEAAAHLPLRVAPSSTPAERPVETESSDPRDNERSEAPKLAGLAPDAFASESDLADAFGVARTTLRRHLREWRPTHMNNDWISPAHPRPRDPKFLYRVSSVLPLLRQLGWRGNWPIGDPPTGKNQKKAAKKKHKQ